jgi:hypothetical protein
MISYYNKLFANVLQNKKYNNNTNINDNSNNNNKFNNNNNNNNDKYLINSMHT